MGGIAELVLEGEADAARVARRFAVECLPGGDDEVRYAVELVVTELVTNAFLHGVPPVVLRVLDGVGGVRVEVADSGRAVPVPLLRRSDAMTGRGLEVVAAFTSGWGVERGPAGKTVWAEIAAHPAAREEVASADLDLEDLLAEWADDAEGAERRYEVRLGPVPTELLLAAKVQVDNVVRELALERTGELSSGVQMPPALAALVEAVTVDFAEARAEIKRQAMEAAARHEQTVQLTLRLPLSAAAAGERYLAALEEVDRQARAARMLTLAPPRSHQAFRRWYVQSLIDGLRSAAAGEPPALPRPFAEQLAAEVDRLAALEETSTRLRLLQRITAELTAALTVGEAAEAVVRNACTHPGVQTVRVFLRTGTTLRSIARSAGEESSEDPFTEIPIDADLPGPLVARTGEPLFLRTLAQIHERFPQLEGYYSSERSLHIVPLVIGGQGLGVLALTFLSGEVADEAQLAFVRAIADALAQALDRVRTVERAEEERRRERQLLTAQLEVLSDSVAGRPLGEALSTLLLAVEEVSQGGLLASVLLLDEDGRRLRHCAAPSLPADYNAAIDGIEIGPGVGSCGTAAYRRQQVIVTDITTDPLWGDFRELAAAAKVRACWSTPILGTGGRLLGTFAMYYPQPQSPRAEDLSLIDVMVRTVTMVIERSRADEQRERALAAERAAALTLQHSLLPAVPERAGALQLAARYRTGDPGVEVGGDWFDAVAVTGGTVLVVGDVQGHDLAAAALMGQLRTVGRAAALDGQTPAGILAALHRYLVSLDTDLLATALVVRVDEQGRGAVFASAGHLPPLIVSPGPDGGWQAQDIAVDVDAPLGLDGLAREHVRELPPQALLLLYTDGLVENRAWPIDHGLALLRKAMEALPPGVELGEVLDAALELVPSGSRGDDVALLAAMCPPA